MARIVLVVAVVLALSLALMLSAADGKKTRGGGLKRSKYLIEREQARRQAEGKSSFSTAYDYVSRKASQFVCNAGRAEEEVSATPAARDRSKRAPSGCDECPGPNEFQEPDPDVLEPLSAEEMEAAVQYLYSQTDLEIESDYEQITIASNYVWNVELFVPPKAQVIDHLYNEGPRPDRAARIIVFRGADDPPHVQEYKVGPLPNPSAVEPLWSETDIPYGMRPVDDYEYAAMEEVVAPVLLALTNLTLESYGLSYTDDCEFCINWSDNGPRGYQRDDPRHSWIWTLNTTEGWYLEPLGLEFRIHHASLNASEWTITDFVYFGQHFETLEELLDAYENGNLEIFAINATVNDEASGEGNPRFSSMRERGEQHEYEDRQGSVSLQPEGDRYRVTGRRIEWMGWSFLLGYTTHSGPVLWDVTFEGERIAYEIALCEAYVAYSGYGPLATNTYYTDSGWGMGVTLTPLAKGIDCPSHAMMIDQVYWAAGGPDSPAGPDILSDAICIWEDDVSQAIYRHYETVGVDNFYSGVRDHRLVVRTSAAVWNYDYLFDIRFGVDGSIEVEATSSGYIQAGNSLVESLTNPDDLSDRGTDYGYRVGPYTWSHLHDHLLHYKVDLDVAGGSNYFETMTFKTRQVQRSWNNLPSSTYLKYAERETQPTELGLAISMDEPAHWVFFNSDQENKWGNPRGYRVHIPGSAKQLLADDHPYMIAGAWSKYHLAVTRQNDEERYSTHMFDMQACMEPIVAFDRDILNDEDIVDQDLVAWITVGTLHMPVAEDIPNTVMPGSYGKFSLKPHNFFDYNPSARIRENAYIVTTDGARDFEQYGLGDDGSCQAREFVLEYLGARAPHSPDDDDEDAAASSLSP